MLSWAGPSGSDPDLRRNMLVYAFFLFVLGASFYTRLIPSPPLQVGIYVAFSLVLMLSPFVLAKYRPVTGSPALGAQNIAG